MYSLALESKKKKMETIQEILTEAGHITDGDNRNRAIKGCNSALKAGIKIKVAQVGRMYCPKDTTKKAWTVQVSYAKRMRRGHPNTGGEFAQIQPIQVLKLLANFLQDPIVKDALTLHSHTPSPCCKCNGAGIIPKFMYYANGICFDCMGLGTQGKFEIIES